MEMTLRRKRTIRAGFAALIVLSAFFLSFYNFGYNGFGNLYYAAAVKSMSMSWHNFFYLSFDPAGFISVDKPPVALWVETAFVRLFGFHSFSLMLPGALAAAGSVAVLYHLVKRSFGFAAGCVAAALLSVTPIFIAAARSNNPDAILVLVLLLAVWCVSVAAETGRAGHLALAAAVLGLGFDTKMLAAYLILPACAAVYLFACRAGWKKKALHLGLAAVVLAAVSFGWVAAVDLTPAASRPYVGSSADNSEMNLVFGYNGLNRLRTSRHIMGNHTAQRQPAASAPPQGSGADSARTGTGKANRDRPGILRMLEIYLTEQIGWFLPLAAVGAVGTALSLRQMQQGPRRRKWAALLLWSCWAGVMLLFFSFYRSLTHRYYLNIAAPGLAALGGIGFSALLKWMLEGKGVLRRLFLPAGLVLCAAFDWIIIAHYPAWCGVLWPFDAVCIGLAAALPFLLRRRTPRTAVLAACTALVCLLAAPAAWSFTTVSARVNGSDAYAGPSLLGKSGRIVPTASRLLQQPAGDCGDPAPAGFIAALSAYLERRQGGAQYLLATPGTAAADQIILYTGRPAMAIGGYNGTDPVLTLRDFQNMVRQGKVKYLLDTALPAGARSGPNAPLLQWARQNGKVVDPASYLGPSSGGKGQPTLICLSPGAP